jgi:CheY-like chemotaxis protein
MSQKILIADKSITIQKIVELTFQEEDFEVISVSNGREALDKIQQIQPNIILADISLPEIDGYELCRTLRQDSNYVKFSNIPLILLAGIYETMDERKARYVEEKSKEVNSNGVLTKPFDPQDLIQKVKQLALPAEKPREARMKEIEDIFQVEETEAPPEAKAKSDETMLLSDEERRYIMGMPAEKELSPELTEDIFEEGKAEEPFDANAVIKEAVKAEPPKLKNNVIPSAPVAEPLFEEPKAEAEETIFQEEPAKSIPAQPVEDIFKDEKILDDSPIAFEVEKTPVPAVFEDDILGISEIAKEEPKPAAKEEILEAPAAISDVFEIKEEVAQEQPIEENIFEEPAPVKEEPVVMEEAIDLKREFESTPEILQAEEMPSEEHVTPSMPEITQESFVEE